MEFSKEVHDLNTLTLPVPTHAREITTIKSSEDYVRASEILINIKAIRKKIEETFKPIKQKMDAAKKEVLDQEKAADSPLKEAEAWIKPLMMDYDKAQEILRQEQQRKLQEEARRQEEEQRLEAALEAEMEGDKEGAADIINEEVYVPPVILPKATPQVQGISYREVWKHEVTSLMQLVRGVADAKVPLNALQANEVFLGQQVRSMKQLLNYPGVKVWAEKTIAAGRR